MKVLTLFVLPVVLVLAEPSYCLHGEVQLRGWKEIPLNEARGRVSKAITLNSSECNVALKRTYNTSADVLAHIRYAEVVIDDRVVVRGITNDSWVAIKHNYVGDRGASVFETYMTIILGCWAVLICVVPRMIPRLGLVILPVAMMIATSSHQGYQGRLAPMHLLQQNIFTLETRVQAIVHERATYQHPEHLLPILNNTEIWLPEEQFCYWRKFAKRELYDTELSDLEHRRTTSAFRGEVIGALLETHGDLLLLESNNNFTDGIEVVDLLKNWRRLFQEEIRAPQPSIPAYARWNDFYELVRADFHRVNEHPLGRLCYIRSHDGAFVLFR